MDGRWEAECHFAGEFAEDLCQLPPHDDDCDGVIDGMQDICGNVPTSSTSTIGIGLCRLGERTCTNGMWGACEGVVEPRPEICNEADEDCDGVNDNGLTPSYHSNTIV